MVRITNKEEIAFYLMLYAYYLDDYYPAQKNSLGLDLEINTSEGSETITIRSHNDLAQILLKDMLISNWEHLDLSDALLSQLIQFGTKHGFNIRNIPNHGVFSNWIKSQEMLKAKYSRALKEFNAKPSEERAFYKMMATLAELFEALNELPVWKYWKRDTKIRRRAFIEELADVLHFFAEVCIDLEISPEELIATYYLKNTKNLLRQRGYFREADHVQTGN